MPNADVLSKQTESLDLKDTMMRGDYWPSGGQKWQPCYFLFSIWSFLSPPVETWSISVYEGQVRSPTWKEENLRFLWEGRKFTMLISFSFYNVTPVFICIINVKSVQGDESDALLFVGQKKHKHTHNHDHLKESWSIRCIRLLEKWWNPIKMNHINHIVSSHLFVDGHKKKRNSKRESSLHRRNAYY